MTAIEVRKADADSVAAIIRGRYRIGDVFTANDLRDLIGAEGLDCGEHGSGAIFRCLKLRGAIAKTGRYVQSTNPRSRGDVLAIWRRCS